MQVLAAVVLLLAVSSAAGSATVQINLKTDAITYAVIGDWGRIGGDYSDGTLATCKKLALQYKNDPSIAAGPIGDDAEGDACGGLEQLRAATLLNQVCGERKCSMIVNTADNFYVNGCFADKNTSHPINLRCAARFQNDWENVYNAKQNTNIRGLKWLNSLGNHDVLGYAEGVNDQIAYGKRNPNWILPARYYNADVKSAKTSIRFHVAHTSCFVKKYRTTTSPYYNDEIISCSSDSAIAAQNSFLAQSMAGSKADWNVVIGHHPAVSASGPSYIDPSQIPPSGADGWANMAALIAKYNPVGYYNGHDHTQSFQYVPEPTVTGDTNITNGYKYTGFYTSGAGSWPQAGDGGHGMETLYSFLKYSNADWVTGEAFSGFIIVTVDSEKHVADYYSMQNGNTVPLRVTTYKGKAPMWEYAPAGVSLVKLANKVEMTTQGNADGVGDETVVFRRKAAL